MQPAPVSPLEGLMLEIGARARAAAAAMLKTTASERTQALEAIAEAIEAHAAPILAANAADVEAAKAEGLKASFVDRLALDGQRLEGMAAAVRAVAAQDDPVGQVVDRRTMPNGLDVARVRGPLGVIGMIFESRPNVASDAAALAIRSGNALILRSGSDALASCQAIHAAVAEGLGKAGLPRDAVQLVPIKDREAVGMMLSGLDGSIDLIVPRGGKSLVERVLRDARVAVLGHLEGLCHVYVDRDADLDMARSIVVNAKMRRPGICGAAETLLVDRARAEAMLPPLAGALQAAGCALKGDAAARALVASIAPADETDFRTEYLAPVINVALVDGVEGAMAHIARYGTGHTESIVTDNAATAERFLRETDSAIVLHNASTQFADGGELGLGAEIGIATAKLHARGPVGAAELTVPKFVVRGAGQTRP